MAAAIYHVQRVSFRFTSATSLGKRQYDVGARGQLASTGNETGQFVHRLRGTGCVVRRRGQRWLAMDPALQLMADTGVALRREMLAMGFDDKDIRHALRSGQLHRVRHGAYTTSDRWTSATATERHHIRCVAVSRQMDGHVALTHTSALVALGIDVWGADLSKVHVTRLDDATGRVCAGVHHHDAVATEPDLVRTPSGLLVSSPARAVLEHASLSTIVSGLVSADHGLHLGLFTDEELADRHRAMEHWPGMRHVQVVIRLADGRSESPGETRTRHLCWRAGLPAPVLQYEVYDARGRFVGRTDFAWPRYRLLGEFDGPGQVPQAPSSRPGGRRRRTRREASRGPAARGHSVGDGPGHLVRARRRLGDH